VVSGCEVLLATISHHLRVVFDAGLMETRREGQFIHKRALPKTMQGDARTLARLSHAELHRR
jgi:DNA-binding transcriptional ArsR family regulator